MSRQDRILISERCRQAATPIHLATNRFGPGRMCSYCGHFWSEIDHKVRVGSGKKPAKFIEKIIKTEEKVGRFRKTLVKKAIKNSGNRMIYTCSFCSKHTKIKFTKPSKFKTNTENDLDDLKKNQTPVERKRKKRTKDKTAGLIINPDRNSPHFKSTPIVKPTNINKLGAMVGGNLTPSKKSSLYDFITEMTR